MPPKPKKEAPKNLGPVEDETGIPKNEVSFKFSFKVKQNEIENILIMFEWISSVDGSAREKFDTDLIESWTQVDPSDPTLVTFEFEPPYSRVEDKFVKNICSNKFYVYFVSVEDQCVKDTILLHYSPLLTAKGEPKFEFYHDKIKIPQIESFQLTLSADKELLTPLYKDYLNPLEVCIVGAKEMPFENTSFHPQEPVYVQAKFLDGTVIKTNDHVHARTCKWQYKQVLLVGLMDPVKLTEYLRTTPLQFEVHDQDELAKNQIKDFKKLTDIKYEEPEPPVEVIDPKAKGGKGALKKGQPDPKKKEEKPKEAAKDAKGKDAKGKKDAKKKKDVKTFEPIKQADTREICRTNFGVSNFNLNDLMNPHVTSLKLRNYIVPIQKYENKDAEVLDLNTTAKRELKGAHIASDYIANESYLVVTFDIAHAIRPFKLPPPPAEPEGTQANLAPGKQAGKAAANKQQPPPVQKPPSNQKAQKPKPGATTDAVPTLVVMDEKPILERAIYIFPYKSPEITPKLMSIVHEINMAAFGMTGGNPLFVSTKALTEEEKKNKDLDIITGIEFIDNEFRTFIFEGISDRGMKRLEESFPKEAPNSKELKIIKNSDIKFKDRLYLDCNIDIKKIRLRENLAKLLTRPEIYSRSKVPENIYNILLTFLELRRCDNMKAVVASNLFPDLETIISMERKYGDALTDEDINGKECPPQKTITRVARNLQSLGSELTVTQLPSLTSGRIPSTKLQELSSSAERGQNTKVRPYTTNLPTMKDDVKGEKYTFQMRNLYPVNEGEKVYTNSESKLNIYEKQKAELREIARNDPNHFYTYSAEYLTLSIDPVNEDDVKKKKEEEKKKMWRTQSGFQTVVKKDPKDYNVHPKKPHPSIIEELRAHPYHQSKEEETKKLSNTRGDAIRNGKDFMLRLKTQDIFSKPEILETEMITAVEKERRMKEEKKKAEDEWKAKMVVENDYIKTSLCTNKNSQLDKLKGIRDGEAKKKGIVLKESRLKETTLGTTKTIQDNPISIHLEQEWQQQSNVGLFERHLDPSRAMSAYDFRRHVKQSYQYNIVYKPVKEVFPKV